ncbi:uncharacterized protein BX663DRAFT_550041 [Cokeromyces recurvatus]|uniref:uncharacterized protein n=1 Tax=Cokeromyces recurvatus TaxID=90255 RepID=UPI00221F485F|nr:uncharacterized protein BX663DRAFT_550041 [Cokeromyces recurvatus]KAI7905212.1 hypothetical protein BX663DRAFT_550041 [Cokeromyces recurvatus]
MSEDEEEKSSSSMELVMDKIELGVMQLPHMIWAPTKYKPQQIAQFISLLQIKNCKIRKAALEARIEINNATTLLCAAFEDLMISDSAVHCHITEKLEFTLIRTQARVVERNSESII